MSISAQQKPLNTGFDGKTDPNGFLADIDLTGKTALVTGGYSGIGLETVRALTNAGAQVFVPARDRARAIEALQGIIPAAHIGDMDLADIGHVRRFAEAFGENHTQLDILIANAGVMACPEQRTQTGWEWQIGVNHFGHFALLQGLLPLLRRAGEAGRRVWSRCHRLATGLAALILTICITTKNLMKNGRLMASPKPPNRCSLCIWTRWNKAMAFAPLPSIRAGFSPRCNAIWRMRKWWLGWTNEDGTPSERAANFFKTPLQGLAQACGAPPPARLTAWAGFIVKIATLPLWWQMMMPARPVCGAGRLTKALPKGCGRSR